jgi:hypothetical protein
METGGFISRNRKSGLYLFSFRCKGIGSNTNNGQSIFEHSAQLEIDGSELLAIDYNSIHNLAKDAIHMVEGLDSVLRSLECALRYHNEMEKLRKDDTAIFEAIHRSLHYRREMFHSTRLRMLSVDQRLKNIINMVRYPIIFPFAKVLKILGLQHWNHA